MKQTDEFNHHIAALYISQLENRDLIKPKNIVSFSGVPGSGKTTLARKLASDLGAQYVHHDSIRGLMTDIVEDPKEYSLTPISYIILKELFAKDTNKCIILDASIDRSWRAFFDNAKSLGVDKPIVIRLNVKHDILSQRQLGRDGKINARFDDFVRQFNDCKNLVKADMELEENYEYENVLNELALRIENRH